MDDRLGKSGMPTVPGRQAARQNPGVHCVPFTYSSFLLDADQFHLTLLGPERELEGRDGEMGQRKEREEVLNGTNLSMSVKECLNKFCFIKKRKRT